jgi:hypothetical protein
MIGLYLCANLYGHFFIGFSPWNQVQSSFHPFPLQVLSNPCSRMQKNLDTLLVD